jgi:hypothetical protein
MIFKLNKINDLHVFTYSVFVIAGIGISKGRIIDPYQAPAMLGRVENVAAKMEHPSAS